MKDHKVGQPIILASSSPRRQELLAGLGIPFSIHTSDVDETIDLETAPERIVEQLAKRKASAVATNYKEGLIIGSDTIVVLDSTILGKPKDDQEAFHMLSSLQGRVHFVYTGLAIIDVKSGTIRESHKRTEVRMRPLTTEEIHGYIATGEPRDKAGAYGIQGIGATLVEGIIGDYFTVVGLPLELLASELRSFGFEILTQIK